MLSAGEIQLVQSHVSSREDNSISGGVAGPCHDLPTACRIIPEYERQMRRVVVSLSVSDAAPTLQDEVLRLLPNYTKIVFLVPSSRLEETRNWLAAKEYRNRITFATYDPQYRNGTRLYLLLPDEDQLVPVDTDHFSIGTQHGTLWAQDLFEVASDESENLLLRASCVHKCFQGMRNHLDRHIVSDNTYLNRLENSATQVQHLDLAFKGGNLLIDRIGNETTALCGYDSIRSTRTVWSALHGETLSDSMVVERFQKALGVDRVVLAGPARPQPKLLYHLDQAMLLLPGSVAAVSRVTGPVPRLEPDASQIRNVRAFLADLRTTLEHLGYTLIDMETPVENVLQYRHYVNAIPYVDANTGARTVLMPVFPETDDEQIVSRNVARFEQLGYSVVRVPTTAYRLTGGIHCLVNVFD